jgi:hypothetical protein
MQIFVDMDGVLADFDRGYAQAFGVAATKETDNVDWTLVRNRVNFYRDLPPMADMPALWQYLAPYNPIVLTGVPHSVEEAPANKRAWVEKWIGPHVEVRTCFSREKCLHAKPGDLLIDDWIKYRDRWIEVGGRWITHVSASDTIAEMKAMGL